MTPSWVKVVMVAMVVFSFASSTLGATQASGAGASEDVWVPYYSPPNHLDLCGEPVPLHEQDVWERFDREFTIIVYAHAQVYLWLKRSKRFFPWFEAKLRALKLPDDLKYVAVAESDLLHKAISPMGAVGLWQFIPGTGKRYGLEKVRYVDERYDFEQATDSALRYLKDLYDMFQSWTLAIAAYNCGEQRMKEEINRQGVRDYYRLKLPNETERYIFRILAIKTVLGSPGRYGYHLPPDAGYPLLTYDVVPVRFPFTVPVKDVATKAGITYRTFKRFNPQFIGTVVPPGAYKLRFPVGKGSVFESDLDDFFAKYKPHYVRHVVRRGDTLSRIARRYRVSIRDLRRWNHLRSSRIYVGQVLIVKK